MAGVNTHELLAGICSTVPGGVSANCNLYSIEVISFLLGKGGRIDSGKAGSGVRLTSAEAMKRWQERSRADFCKSHGFAIVSRQVMLGLPLPYGKANCWSHWVINRT